MLAPKLWDKWKELRLHLARPELGLDGTNNAVGRRVGKSRVRYKSMRGHKSVGGMVNAIALSNGSTAETTSTT